MPVARQIIVAIFYYRVLVYVGLTLGPIDCKVNFSYMDSYMQRRGTPIIS